MRDGAVLPWYLRWKLPAERPMLLLVGRRGTGKTLLAVKIAQDRMRRGEKVYANFPIETEDAYAGYVPSLLHCIDLEDCTIVIDEANIWCSSRQWQLIPDTVVAGWQESRKAGVSFIFTAQHESRVDTIIRELVDWVLVCERVPFVPRWVPWFRYHRTFIEELTQVRAGKVSRAVNWIARHSVFQGYATWERLGAAGNQQLRDFKGRVKEVGADAALAEVMDAVPRIEPMRKTSKGFHRWVPCEQSIIQDA